MVVAVVVAFQCFSIPYGRSLLLSQTNNGSIVMIIGNVSAMDHSKSTKIYMAMDNDEETEEMDMDYDLTEGVENYPHDSFLKYEDEHTQREFTFKKDITHGKSSIMKNVTRAYERSTETKDVEIDHGNLEKVEKVKDSKIDDGQNQTTSLTLGGVQYTQSRGDFRTNVQNLDANSRTSDSIFTANLSSIGNVKQTIEAQPTNPKLSQAPSSMQTNNFAMANISILMKRVNKRPTTISQMNALLLRSHVSSRSVRPQSSSDFMHLYFEMFPVFERSYELMENILKVYIYKEGEKPVFHQARTRGIYASEGWFMKLMEGNRKFVVRDPRKAHLFYLPFSAQMLRNTLLGQKSQNHRDLQNYLNNYVKLISRKYRFWNRTDGADHFLVACHDWAPQLTRKHMRNCIRALCNANVAKGLKIGMDTTLPVTYIRSAEAPLEELGGRPPLERPTLAFFAGSMHGYLRPILLNFWEHKVDDMKIFDSLPRDIEGKRIYREHMKSSKYCICARGYQVHTPRVVEAIFFECVPVIISDNYVPPFFEVLNWEAFSVFVLEKDIPNLRSILLSIPEERYLAMHARVQMVQKHFFWHKKPEKYDLFHMILHSVWYNRVFNVKRK
ncbi:Exostosin family protein [Melia azedarach]|nr:Exostosin family protein [Melia azedarach]